MQDDARAALAALSDIPRYEERLTSRAAGITLMVWGLAVPGIFLTYNLAGHLLPQGPWFALLWLPWVAAGSALSGAVWHTQAITLRRPSEPRKGWLYPLGYTAAFFAIMGAVYLLLHQAAGVRWEVNSTMMLVNGLFAVLVGATQRRLPSCGPPTMVAGALLGLLGIALAAGGLPGNATAFIGAAASGLAWFLPGLWATVKG